MKYCNLLFVCSFSLCLLGCDQKDSCLDEGGSYNETTKICEKDNAKENQKSTISYSNLTDEASQNLIKNTLKKYNIPQENIDNYFYYVDYFNNVVGKDGLIKQGFKPLQITTNNDSYPDYLTKLEKHNPDFMGTNCRISSFTLLDDFIKIKNPLSSQENSSILIFDKSSIDNFPNKIFSNDEKQKFYTFFGGIKTPLTEDKNVHIKNIKNYWAKQGISINTPKGLSMIMMINHSDLDNELFIGHIGVLLENEGRYIFLEKLSFDLPYQAVIFSKKSQIKDYFMQKYSHYTTPNTANPFLMENGAVFKD